jgi:hypothetical protein
MEEGVGLLLDCVRPRAEADGGGAGGAKVGVACLELEVVAKS